MECIQCGKEFDSNRITARFCSGSCRAKAKRTEDSARVSARDVSARAPDPPEVSVDDERDEYKLTDEQLADLPTGVTKPGSESVAWSCTEHYYKLMHQLVTWSLKRLEEAGTWIPAWRRLEG